MLRISTNAFLRSLNSLQLLIWLLVTLILLFNTKSVCSNNGFRMMQVRRFMESPVRNSFKLKSETEEICSGRICERRNSYLTGGGGTQVCQCQCLTAYVYSSSLDKCIFADEGKRFFLILHDAYP